MFLPSVFILRGERPRHRGSLRTVPRGSRGTAWGKPAGTCPPPTFPRWPTPAHCAHGTHCSLQTFYRNTHLADYDPHATPQPSCYELPALLEKGLSGVSSSAPGGKPPTRPPPLADSQSSFTCNQGPPPPAGTQNHAQVVSPPRSRSPTRRTSLLPHHRLPACQRSAETPPPASLDPRSGHPLPLLSWKGRAAFTSPFGGFWPRALRAFTENSKPCYLLGRSSHPDSPSKNLPPLRIELAHQEAVTSARDQGAPWILPLPSRN